MKKDEMEMEEIHTYMKLIFPICFSSKKTRKIENDENSKFIFLLFKMTGWCSGNWCSVGND